MRVLNGFRDVLRIRFLCDIKGDKLTFGIGVGCS